MSAAPTSAAKAAAAAAASASTGVQQAGGPEAAAATAAAAAAAAAAGEPSEIDESIVANTRLSQRARRMWSEAKPPRNSPSRMAPTKMSCSAGYGIDEYDLSESIAAIGAPSRKT